MKTAVTRIHWLLTFILVISFFPGFAQPTLTSATNGLNGNIGMENFYGVYHTVVAPGNSGASQNWDFSAISSTSGSSEYYYNCVAPVCDSFPGSNFYSLDLTNYSVFMNTSSNATTLLGASSSGLKTKYTDPDEIMHFPFTYGNSYADSFRNTTKYGSTLTSYEWGVDSVTADGWGSIKTPTGTYPSALRIRRIKNLVDSSSPTSVSRTHNISYYWYATTQTDYLFSIFSSIVTGSVTDTNNSANWIGHTTGIISNVFENRIKLVPNPVTAQLKIQYQANQNAKADIRINDMTGRTILQAAYQIQSGENNWNLDLSTVSSGVYVLCMQDGKSRYLQRFQKL